ncbi:hypothetical protein AUR64_13330 [Haloprofundus marisrubri]|uniref:Uncharacterized protein n=1 Tax=Haloprofundus marisrubri TaxID=1514971 RepID=A0A0W1R6I2_9EURY|nr:hypothetical protein [Haloprofundus marisrubri]KTG08800.1 hypothetical protein AUR64_13330 [Haloprofundus marisrubri]
MPHAGDIDEDISEAERQALHQLQLGIEYVYRSYGALLDFHHHLGHAMDRMADAEEHLRAAGHDELADELRDRHLPAGALDDRWSYEIVGDFRRNFLHEITDYETGVRDDLVDGLDHVTEREQQREWRERAESDAWKSE